VLEASFSMETYLGEKKRNVRRGKKQNFVRLVEKGAFISLSHERQKGAFLSGLTACSKGTSPPRKGLIFRGRNPLHVYLLLAGQEKKLIRQKKRGGRKSPFASRRWLDRERLGGQGGEREDGKTATTRVEGILGQGERVSLLSTAGGGMKSDFGVKKGGEKEGAQPGGEDGHSNVIFFGLTFISANAVLIFMEKPVLWGRGERQG